MPSGGFSVSSGPSFTSSKPGPARCLASAFGLLLVLALTVSGIAPAAAARYASIVVDADSGAVIHEENADAPRHPASLTKMMTLYLLFDAIDSKRLTFASRLPVSARAAAQAPTKLGLQPGDTIAVRDVILGLITKSANDAAVVAAEALGGSEERFAQIMTERARRLGMANTVFRNASGLPDRRQISTARDLATLSRAIIRSYPHHYALFSTTEFTYDGRTHANHNRLNSWYAGADGLKTGYIRASGFNLATSAMRGNRRLIGVVLGGISPGARDQEMARLLDAAFAAPDGGPIIREARAAKAKPAAQVVSSATKSRARGAEKKVAAAAAVPAPAPTSRATDSGEDWGIQVGAFASADHARKAAERAIKFAPRQLANASVEVAPLARKKGQVYRARVVGVSETEARGACRLLQRRKMDCVALTPAEIRNGVKIAAAAALE